MQFRYLSQAAFVAALIELALAQTVPEDLRGSFRANSQLQVSYTGEAVNGFQDGTTFEKDAVSKVPEFALGDSAAIVPRNRYTILMVDTTCDEGRKLHYARTNFKYNFEIVRIESETEPVLAYKAPGALQETGDDRKYAFLMYGQPQSKEIDELKLPEEGAVFDVKKFQEENGFKDPIGGVGMVVKLGGETSCDGKGTPATPEPVESSSGSSAVASSSSAVASPSSAVASLSAVASSSSAAASLGSSVAASRSAAGGDNATPAPISTGGASSLAPVPSANGTVPGSATSTVLLSSAVPSATGSSTVTGSPAEQTANAAAGLSTGSRVVAILSGVIGIAALTVWS